MKSRARKKYCSCGHAEKTHFNCECPFCGSEDCEYGCNCELRKKHYKAEKGAK